MIKAKDFKRLKKDTVENAIIRRMIAGESFLLVCNDINCLNRCHDEKLLDDELITRLEKNGFIISRLYTDFGDGEKEYSGFKVEWGEEESPRCNVERREER